jgi:hypothetical protein
VNITVEQVVRPTPEVHDLIGELENVLGAAYEADQRHGLSSEQLFEPMCASFWHGRKISRSAVAALRCSTTTARSNACITRPVARGRGIAKALLRRIEDEAH